MLGLEGAFGLLGTTDLTIDEIIQSICDNPRKIFQLPSTIEKNKPADLTIFDSDAEGIFTTDQIKSKSANTPYVGMKFKGSVLGVIKNINYLKKVHE
jgi:dihydroorotase